MDEYFAYGLDETRDLMATMKHLGVNLGTKTAVDFGCGLGRSTQALANYFDQVYGIDIASSILELANSYNLQNSKCKFILNDTNDLSRFRDNSVDLIWSSGVLYLMSPLLCKNYLLEFLRVLVPGGVMVFQLPSCPANTIKGFIFRSTPAYLLNLYRRAKYGFEIYSVKRADVVGLIERAGGKVLIARDDRSAGNNWIGFQYYVVKTNGRDKATKAVTV
jgi:ubiquinone/menaquinone biosynthesis C-methylase UbiE